MKLHIDRMAPPTKRGKSAGHLASSLVLRSHELLPLVVAFQHGLYLDMLPIYRAMLRYSPKEHPLYYCPEDIHPLLAAFPRSRLPALVACMPYMRSVLFLQAAQFGPLDLLHTLESLFSLQSAPTFLLDLAAQNGHLEVLRYLHTHAPHVCGTTAAMDSAAGGGYMDVVRFLHENRREGCTKAAMDTAAAAGHLAIVAFLHEEREEGCTDEAMEAAAAAGHLNVVEFLHDNRWEGDLEKARDGATDGTVVAYLTRMIRADKEDEDDETGGRQESRMDDDAVDVA
ncbi:Aste57867_311 [Aphanomyces stellatus]|uniref:Aste57867_311 protein n=1 Tax=Aphanomyces stellatus TaxID=120398 RepID=A0A485K7G7_9STRA|nr:hypothetical protein As57867_000311 [Aphanomyces stellatus]VFT77537.1 Aste57867_311 [Aphanomyces stellatus]